MGAVVGLGIFVWKLRGRRPAEMVMRTVMMVMTMTMVMMTMITMVTKTTKTSCKSLKQKHRTCVGELRGRGRMEGRRGESVDVVSRLRGSRLRAMIMSDMCDNGRHVIMAETCDDGGHVMLS